jgi:hypothetical protein
MHLYTLKYFCTTVHILIDTVYCGLPPIVYTEASSATLTHTPLHSSLCCNFLAIYRRQKPIRNRVLVPARQATKAGGIDSMESVLGSIEVKNTASGLLFTTLIDVW